MYKVRDDDDLFRLLMCARDRFKDGVKKAWHLREKELKDNKGLYSAEGMKQLTDRLDDEYKNRREGLAAEVKDAVFPRIDAEEEKCLDRVRTIKPELINRVKILSDRKMTLKEFEAVAEKTCQDYWSSRYLETLADLSDICVEDTNTKLIPKVDVQLAVLNEIRDETEQMLREYDPTENSTRDIQFLHSARLTEWEDRYTNGLRFEADLSDDARIRRAWAAVSSKSNAAECGREISKQLDCLPEHLRNRFLDEIAQSGISDLAVMFSGRKEQVEACRQGAYQDARQAVKMILGGKDVPLTHDLRNNQFFVPELTEAGKRSYFAREYIDANKIGV